MIYNELANCEQYFAMNKNFKKAFDFLKNVSADFPDGRHDIDGDDVYANVMSYTTKNEEDCVIEGHRKYIDIQYVISGTEIVEVTDISMLKSSVPYDEEKDAEFFAQGEGGKRIVMEADKFAIFFPNNLHRGAIKNGQTPVDIKKVVVKVRL